MKEGDDVVATGTSDTDGKITFTAISYSLDDRGTTHTYVVSEDADTKDGVTNTTSTNTVKVTVNDKGNGELEAVATDDSPVAINAVNFENAYDAKGKATVEVAKHLEGRELTSEDEFRFTLSAVSAGATLQDESLADIDTDLLTITNGADGVAVYFPDLYYTLSQKNAEYIYKIVEEEFNITDVSRDTDNGPDVIYVKVKVGDDNGDGTLADATVTYWKDEDCTIELKKSEFVNKYSSLIEVPLEAKKEMQGRKLGDNDFSFTLTNKKETENQNTFPITVNQRKGNHGEQVVFDVLRFAVYPTKQQVEEEGYIDITNLLDENHQFVLKLELAEDISSLENSVFPVKPIPEKFDVAGNEITKVAYDVTITLEHNIKTGKLSASVSPDKVDDLLFINKVLYLKKVDEEGTAIAGAKFEIVDKEGNAQIFEFETKDDDQNTENVDESLIELEHLAINKYYILREINAPDDYILTKDTVFHINEKGEIEFSEINPQVRKAEFKDSEGIAIEAIQVENKPASKPEFEKKIMDINDSTGDVSKWQDSADYDIGDVIPFKLTATLADNVTDYRYYKIIFHDEMEESLEFCKDSIQVKLFTKDNQPMEEPEIKQGDGYYADSLHSFDQMFDWGDKTTRISDTRLNGARVELYFTAKLTGDKVKFGKEGNVNTAWLEYSSSPRVNDNGDQSTETKETEKDSVIAFTYKVVVNKVDEDGKALTGAKFKLEKKIKDSENKVIAQAEAEPGATFTFAGLDDGDYVLTETYVPAGMKAIDPIEFTVTAEHNVEWKVEENQDRMEILTELTGNVTTGELKLDADKEKLTALTGDVKNEEAEKPKFEKKIQDTNDTTGKTSGWQDSADYDISDAVPYKLTATLADNVTDYLKYHITFHDTMEDGLTFKGIDKVTVNGTEVDAADYDLTFKDHSFDLTLTWTGENGKKIADIDLNKAEVEVYFTAELNEDAARGNQGNVNTAKLIYSCSPNVDELDKTEETKEDSVIAFTYDVVVNKVDKDGKALTGAEFKLEKKLADNTLEEIKRLTVKENVFTFSGLDDGDYVLTETRVPANMKAIDPIEFTVTAEHNVEWKVEENQDRLEILTDLTGNVTTGKLKLAADDDLTSLTGDVKNEEAEKPKFDKKIQDTNDTTGKTSGWQDSADYDIGDAIPYKLTANLADNVTDYLQYHITFHDSMDEGLTFKGIDKVTVNGAEVAAADYDLTSKDHSFDLTLTWAGENGKKIADTDLNKAAVEVYFTAELNENAVLGNQGNVNTAKLIYSCSPNADELDKTEETKEDSVIAFTYEVVVNKIDEDGKALTGAEFKLEKKLTDGTLKLLDVVKAESGATFTFKGLDDGDYVLTETKVPDGRLSIDPIEFTVTAEHNIEWKVEENQDRLEILTGLTGNVTTGELKLEAEEKLTGLIGDVVNTKTHVKVQKVDVNDQHELEGAKIQIIDEEGTVVFEFTSGEEATDIEGLKTGVTYTLHEEVAPNGYLTRSDTTFTIDEKGNVTGSATIDVDEEGNVVLLVEDQMKKVSATVRKVWDDDEDRDGLRPNSITVSLLQNGVVYKSVPLNAANNWTSMVKDLPAVDSECNDYTYTWAEPVATEGYTMTSIKTVGTLTTLTNTHGQAETEVKVRKVWADNDNAAQKRPASITVQLYADGQVSGTPITLDASNNWSGSWTKLTKNEKGTEIKYTVAETTIPEGYVATITGNASTGYVITNTYDTGKLVIEKEFDIEPWEFEGPDDSPMDIPVIKTWNDNGNKDGNRPEAVTVRLLADGTEVANAQLTEANNWRYTFTGLPRLTEEKEKISYTITEDPVEWYEAEIHGFNIRNNYKPVLTSVSVRKEWEDNNNAQNLRPTSIVMTLSNGMTVVLDANNNWTATIDNLPTRVNGQPVTYTWTEQTVLNYNLVDVVTEGALTTFTNRVWVRPTTTTTGGGTPKRTGDTVTFEEYETPLGVEIVINHVGDCFD